MSSIFEDKVVVGKVVQPIVGEVQPVVGEVQPIAGEISAEVYEGKVVPDVFGDAHPPVDEQPYVNDPPYFLGPPQYFEEPGTIYNPKIGGAGDFVRGIDLMPVKGDGTSLKSGNLPTTTTIPTTDSFDLSQGVRNLFGNIDPRVLVIGAIIVGYMVFGDSDDGGSRRRR